MPGGNFIRCRLMNVDQADTAEDKVLRCASNLPEAVSDLIKNADTIAMRVLMLLDNSGILLSKSPL